MEKELKNIVNGWILKANRDLLTIEHELTMNEPVTDSICFHAQQTAEKYLKAYLISEQKKFSRTHNIDLLLQLCIEIENSFVELEEIIKLTDYAVELRYPDDFYIPNLDEAKDAYEVAKKVKLFVIEKIGIDDLLG